MKKSILLVVLLTLVAFASTAIAAAPPKAAGTAPAPAAPASKPVKLDKFTGEVKSVDAMAKSLVVAKGKEEKPFVTDDKTKITKGKEALKFEDLKAGMNVNIEYKKDGDKNIAAAIKVSAPKAAPKKK